MLGEEDPGTALPYDQVSVVISNPGLTLARLDPDLCQVVDSCH